MINTTIAHYNVTAKLGQGGMGEVYRATDTKLDREVAIKVLPESFAQDKERLARFDREAKALASLSHPNVAGIFGVEQEGNVHALVMELVEGEDLSQRLRSGALPVEEALDACKQVAEALEAAHEKGIIHRDLKPANVKVTEDGKVKVLDFGLAKAITQEVSNASTTDSLSPTITADYTMPGTLLGTAAYMSPEQARGKPVDKRSDIWSFGCVLYECLTGKRLFKGEDTTETLASIIKGDPDWSALPSNTPPTIHLLLQKCLTKDRKQRLHDIADARVDLEQAIADPTAWSVHLGEERAVAWGISFKALAGQLLVAILLVALGWYLKPTTEPTEPSIPSPQAKVRFAISLPPDQELIPQQQGWISRNMAISPDGSELVYVAETHGERALFRRRFDQLDVQKIPHTQGARFPMYSPAGDAIAFFSSKQIKTVTLGTGLPEIIGSQSGVAVGGCWSPDGFIYFTPLPTGGTLVKMSVATSETNLVASPKKESGEVACFYPQVLVPGKSILYSSMGEGWSRSQAKIMVLDLETKQRTEVKGLTGTDPTYVATGHLVFARDEQLLAVPFDPDRAEVIGEQFILEPNVNSILGGEFSLSRSGHLALQPARGLSELVWVDETGGVTPAGFPPGRYFDPKIDPSGKFVVLQILEDDSNYTVAVGDLSNGSFQRIADHKAFDFLPRWSPDGRSIYFTSAREGVPDLYRVNLHGGDDKPVRLFPQGKKGLPRWAFGWSKEDRLVILDASAVALLDVNDTTQIEKTAFKIDDFLNNHDLAIHPNGDWVAYASNQGRPEPYQVFVERFPGGGSKTTISTEGGYAPIWNTDGGELFFQKGNDVLSVRISIDGETLQKEDPRLLFQGDYLSHYAYANYAVDPNSNRLLMIRPISNGAPDNQIIVARNALQANMTSGSTAE